jgi:MoxR-like ATPase
MKDSASLGRASQLGPTSSCFASVDGSLRKLAEEVANEGYQAHGASALALRKLAAQGAGLFLCEGPPGTGKTALAEVIAKALGPTRAAYQYYLCHAWTTDEDLFVGIDVAEAVAGRAERVSRPGFLQLVAEASLSGRWSVACLDELDKAPERVDALLLDFLQNGRVPVGGGRVLQADLSRVIFFVTTNRMRPLAEALQRRLFRLGFTTLPEATEVGLLSHNTAPQAAHAVVRMANLIRAKGATTPSLQELRGLVRDLPLLNTPAEARLLLEGWLIKDPADRAALEDAMGAGKAEAALLALGQALNKSPKRSH